MANGPLEVLSAAIRTLDAQGIPHMLGGSMASSIHGIARFTEAADMVIDLRPDQIELLARALETEFYVSREAMHEAVREQRSFNAIHLSSVVKIDFFILSPDPFDQEQFRRRAPAETGEPGGPKIMLASAEDTILRKLQWFRAGGEASEQQWRDVLGVLRVTRGKLDVAYLERWSAHIGGSDLLQKAIGQAWPEDPVGAG